MNASGLGCALGKVGAIFKCSGWNPVMGVRGDCDPGALGFVTSNAFAQLPWFRELVWIGLWLLCLALIGRRSVPIQNGRAHNSGNDS